MEIRRLVYTPCFLFLYYYYIIVVPSAIILRGVNDCCGGWCVLVLQPCDETIRAPVVSAGIIPAIHIAVGMHFATGKGC
jgi:hypothetical protein